MANYNLIKGNIFEDQRGKLNFFNSFNLHSIVRLYEISPSNLDIVRAWQGHQKEKKWFYCNSGSFCMNLIEVDDFNNPSQTIKPIQFILDSKEPSVLEISGGFATGFKALEENSKLLVFSDFSVEESKSADFRFEPEFWKAKW